MKINKSNKWIYVGALIAPFIFGACQKKVAEKKDVDTSENIFTGTKTVTEETDTTYQHRKTGAKTNKTKTKETKYDKSGNKISETEEMEKEKE